MRSARHGSDYNRPVEDWHVGLLSSEACRAWLRAPEAWLLDDESVQESYRTGRDDRGEAMPESAQGLVHFMRRANLGQCAVARHGSANMVLVRHPKNPTWIALLEEWGSGITVYSRWAAVATIRIDYAPSEQDFMRIIRSAQLQSSRRPEVSRSGADYLDPEKPMILVDGEEQEVRPPDLADRVMARVRDFFA
jgi:hypothetical protein